MKTTELKRLREKAGFKAAELSRLVGKSNSYIASLELRHENVPKSMIGIIQAALTGNFAVKQEAWEFEGDEWLGNRLLSLSRIRQSNVSSLCKTLGISRAYFYQCCSNERRPSRRVCEGLASQMQVDPGYFFGYVDELLDTKDEEMVIVGMKRTTYDLIAKVMQRAEGSPLQTIRVKCPFHLSSIA